MNNLPTPPPAPSTPPVQAVRPETNTNLSNNKFPVQIILIAIGFIVLVGVGIGAYLFVKNKQPKTTSTTNTITGLSDQTTSSKSVTPAYNSSDPEIAKYDKDSDGNAIPDFVEEALGYDPLVDDCARDTGCDFGDTGKYIQKPDNTLLILDSSGSMGLKLGGETRMSAAKSVIKEWIDSFSQGEKVALMVYGHKGSNSSTDKALSCSGIEILYPLSAIDKENFINAVDSFQATGWTPIAGSLIKARDEVFIGHEKENNRIILISDGEEMCGGNPSQTAKELKDSNINVVIDVIGFSADATAKSQLQEVARQGGGTYYEANSREEFSQALKQWKANFELLIKENVCLQNNYNNWLICLSQMLYGAIGKYSGKGALNHYLIPLCQKLQKEGNSSEYQKCQETKEKIFEKQKETRERVEKEFQQRYYQNLDDLEQNEQENNPVNN